MISDVPPNCQLCARYIGCAHPWMPVDGDIPTDILAVGETPGENEDRVGRVFIGRAGQLLRKGLIESGCAQYRLAFTNAVRCRATEADQRGHRVDRKPTAREIALCGPFLSEDIAKAKPRLVLVLGGYALRAVLGRPAMISKMRGTSWYDDDGVRYFAVYHPAFILRDNRFEKTFLDDLTHAANLLDETKQAEQLQARFYDRYELIEDLDTLEERIQELRGAPLVGCDTEFYPLDPLQPRRVYGITLAWWREREHQNHAIFIPIDHAQAPAPFASPALKRRLVELLPSLRLVVHGAHAEAWSLFALGLHPKHLQIETDTLPLSMAVHGKSSAHDLKTLSHRHTDIPGYERGLVALRAEGVALRKTLAEWVAREEAIQTLQAAIPKTTTGRLRRDEKIIALQTTQQEQRPAVLAAVQEIQHRGGFVFDGEDWGTLPLRDLALPYGCADGDATIQLRQVLRPTLQAQQQLPYFELVLNRAWRLNWEYQRNGVLIDWDEWNWRWRYYLQKKQDIYQRALKIRKVARFAKSIAEGPTKKAFSLGSKDQMQLLLFTVLKLPKPTRKTPTGRISLDKMAIIEIDEASVGHPVVKLLQEYAHTTKMLGSFFIGPKSPGNRLHTDGRLHCEFHNFTESARRGSKPNLQNWTAGDPMLDHGGAPQHEWPDNMRMLLRARPGYTLVSLDFSQLEFRLAACYSQDDAMLEGCRTGDPHTRIATRLQIPRPTAKTTNFAILYGCSPGRLQNSVREQTGIEWDKAKAIEVMTAMMQEYPRLFAWINATHQFIRAEGYVTTPLGHRRLLPHAQGTDLELVERACREGLNHTCQSLGHDLLDIAQQELLDYIWQEKKSWYLLCDMHDGFFMEVPDHEVAAAARLAKSLMEELPKEVLGNWLQCDLPADVSVGTHYGNLQKLKT